MRSSVSVRPRPPRRRRLHGDLEALSCSTTRPRHRLRATWPVLARPGGGGPRQRLATVALRCALRRSSILWIAWRTSCAVAAGTAVVASVDLQRLLAVLQLLPR